MSIFKNSTPIITSGLVLNLDAANTRSYPRSGTTWTDLSGNSNNGTLINGPTYSTNNGGVIVFNGTNYVSGALPTLNTWTMSIWYLANDISSQGVFYPFSTTSTSGLGFGGNLNVDVINRWYFYDGGAGSFTNSNTAIVVNTWYNLVVTKRSTIYNLYTNGSLSLSGVGANLSINLYTLGRRTDGIASVVGRISQASIYNRDLSASEVFQNYNAQKSRYNLK